MTLFAGVVAALSLTALSAIVVAREPKGKPKVVSTPAVVAAQALPAAAQDMVDAIRAAVHSGSIEDLRAPLEMNELPPAVADEKAPDAIAYWRKISADGEGREVLAVLGDVLDAGFQKLALGADPENMDVYVWPAVAEAPLDKLTPAQEVELYRLMTPAEAKAMREKKKWTWYRLVIGADGVWHSFKKNE